MVQCFLTEFIRQRSCQQISRQKTRLTIFALVRDLKDHFRNTRVKRGADVASDHYLVNANLKLKLKRDWTGAVPQRIRYIGCLKDVQKVDEFMVTIRNRYQILQDLMEDDETVDSSGKVVKESFVKVVGRHLAPRNTIKRIGFLQKL